MPQNGHWLAIFEVSPLIPSEKVLNRVFRCQKMITPGVRTAVFYYSFWSKNADHIFLLLFFGRFFGNVVTSISTSNPALKKISGQTYVFLLFRGGNFVSQLSTYSSRTTSEPTRLIRPRPIDCDSGFEQTVKISPSFAPLLLSMSIAKQLLRIFYRIPGYI